VTRSLLRVLPVAMLAFLSAASCGGSEVTELRGPAAMEPHPIALVIEADRPRIVLDTAPDLELAAGPPVLIGSDDPAITLRPADASRLPVEASLWLGKRVRLHGLQGVACEGTVRGIDLVGRVSAPDDALARWHGEGEETAEPPPSLDEIAREAFDIAAEAGGVVLAADVEPDGACEAPVFAQLLESAPPEMVPGEPADAFTEQVVLRAFRALPEHVAIQSRYEAGERERDAPVQWDSRDAAPTVNVFPFPEGAIVTVTASAGEACGDFRGELTAVFRVGGTPHRPEFTLLNRPGEMGAVIPAAAGDVDGDGELDLVLPAGIMRSRAGVIGAPEVAEVPFLGCPC
jgi:hypothetical protein